MSYKIHKWKIRQLTPNSRGQGYTKFHIFPTIDCMKISMHFFFQFTVNDALESETIDIKSAGETVTFSLVKYAP